MVYTIDQLECATYQCYFINALFDIFFKGCATWHILIGQWYIPLWYTSAICFWEGALRFLIYTVVIFIFGCTAYIWYFVFIF